MDDYSLFPRSHTGFEANEASSRRCLFRCISGRIWYCSSEITLYLKPFYCKQYRISVRKLIVDWPPTDHRQWFLLPAVSFYRWRIVLYRLRQVWQSCAEPTKNRSVSSNCVPRRSSPTTAIGQVLGSFLFDTVLFALTKTRWSTVVRPRIDHYWELTTLQDWNTL